MTLDKVLEGLDSLLSDIREIKAMSEKVMLLTTAVEELTSRLDDLGALESGMEEVTSSVEDVVSRLDDLESKVGDGDVEETVNECLRNAFRETIRSL